MLSRRTQYTPSNATKEWHVTYGFCVETYTNSVDGTCLGGQKLTVQPQLYAFEPTSTSAIEMPIDSKIARVPR